MRVHRDRFTAERWRRRGKYPDLTPAIADRDLYGSGWIGSTVRVEKDHAHLTFAHRIVHRLSQHGGCGHFRGNPRQSGNGNAEVQIILGDMYSYEGGSVQQDYAEAAKWYQLAAAQGSAEAQFNLGFLYEEGKGVPQNYAEVVKWYRKAAAQGNAGAQFSLGFLYEKGKGMPQDYAEAVNWYRKAADQGEEGAQFELAGMYANGYGVPQDYVQAHKWVNLAASKLTGSLRDTAEKNRKFIAAKMTRAQIAEAQKLAREWQPTAPKPQIRLKIGA